MGSPAKAASGDERRSRRAAVRIAAHLTTPRWQRAAITVTNMSDDGFMARCDLPLAPGMPVAVEFEDGRIAKARVVWRRPGLIGAAFDTPPAA